MAPPPTTSRARTAILPDRASYHPAPEAIALECALLGGILVQNKQFSKVATFLRPHHFVDDANATVYTELARAITSGQAIDAILLGERLQYRDAFDRVGGAAYIAAMVTAAMPDLVVEYARAVVDAWQAREAIAIGEAIVEASFQRADPMADVLRQAVERLDALAASGRGTRDGVLFDAALDAAVQAADDAIRSGGRIRGLSTGMASVDDATDGLVPGELTILGGRPGMGKSALGWAWAVHVARQERDAAARSGRPARQVAGISIEMSAAALAARALSAEARISGVALRRGTLNDSDVHSLLQAKRSLAGLPLVIEDSAGMTATMIRLRLRQLHRRAPISLVVIDHIHLVEDDEPGRGHDANAKVARVARMALEIAKELDCAVLALAQLNRNLLNRDDRRPSLQDLRQAGAIEENADTVLFVHREEYYLGEAPPGRQTESTEERANRHAQWWAAREAARGKGELIVAKLRYGQAGKIVPLAFDGPTTTWSEPIAAEQEARTIMDQLDMLGGPS